MRPSKRAMALLEGAFDLHVHVKPSVRNRIGDSRELAAAAAAAGMRGLLFKDHDRSTVPDAHHAGVAVPDVLSAGAVCLNAPAGGMNAAAAEAALQMGAAAVFLPTDSARNDGQYWTDKLGSVERRAAAVGEHGRRWTMEVDATDAEGALLPETTAVLELCAEAGALVCTGHLSAAEVSAVVDGAAAVGARVLVTHAPMFTQANADALAGWAAAGALLELVAVTCCGHLPVELMRGYAMEAELIERVGAGSFTLASDLGQVGNPPPVDGLAMFVDGLLGEGIPEDDIATMTRNNSARALGLEPHVLEARP